MILRAFACIALTVAIWLAAALQANAQAVAYPGGTVYDLDPPARQSTRMLESINGADDMQPVHELSERDILRRLAKPVGRLNYTTARGGVGYCTASLISETEILTNHHCIIEATEMVLTMGYLVPRSRRGVAQYPVVLPPIEADQALDYAILKVRGRPGNEWGTVTLDQGTPGDRQSLFIIHHPGGFSQRISLGRCRAHEPAVDGDDLLHVCDTTGGSSGAPIFDNGTRRVVGLHYSAVDPGRLNAGKRMARLVETSRKLAALRQDAAGPQGATAANTETGNRLNNGLGRSQRVDPAAREWSTLKDTSSCAVLKAFIDAHGASPFARYAKARRGELACRDQRKTVARTTPPDRAVTMTPAQRPRPSDAVALQKCKGGFMRDGRCKCPPEHLRRTVSYSAKARIYECIPRQPVSKRARVARVPDRSISWSRKTVSCTGGRVVSGRCVCPRGATQRTVRETSTAKEIRCVRYPSSAARPRSRTTAGAVGGRRITCLGGRITDGRCTCPTGKTATLTTMTARLRGYECRWD